jgi:hypothetical protein
MNVRCWRVNIDFIWSIRAIQLSGRNSCTSSKKSIYARSCSRAHCFTLRAELVFEMNNPCKSQFSMSKRLILFQIAYSATVKKHRYFWKENNPCLKREHLAHCFPVKIEFGFERNNSWEPVFLRWSKAHFVPNWPIQLTCRNTCISWKKIICLRARSFYHIVSL